MNRSTLPVLMAGLAVLLATACTGAPGQPTGGVPTGQPTGGAPTGQPTGTSATGQPTASPQGGGWDVQDPCGLATVEEVSAALGMDAVTAEEQVGDTTTYCNYRTADGTSLMATSFSRGQTFVFDSFANADDAIPVPGIGDGAVFSGGALYIKSGDAVVGIQPSTMVTEDMTDEDIITTISAIAQAIAARL